MASVDAYNDITPRLGVAYDVFGNGRTALKFNAGHYLDAATNDSAYTRNNPANRIVSSIRRPQRCHPPVAGRIQGTLTRWSTATSWC